jgi:hypothetical protein
VENGIAVLGMAGAGDIRQALHQRLGLAHHEFGNDFIVQAVEEFLIADQIAAVQ